jgi:hypothetical protein
MTAARRALITACILFLVVGHLYEIVRRHEHWPFSPYPMFSHRNTKDPVSRLAVYGVPAGEGEPFEFTDAHTGVYKRFRFDVALQSMLGTGGKAVKNRERMSRVFDEYFAYYEKLRDLGYHDGPRLAAIRLYRLEWDFDPWAANRFEAPRTLLLLERENPKAKLEWDPSSEEDVFSGLLPSGPLSLRKTVRVRENSGERLARSYALTPALSRREREQDGGFDRNA